MSLGKWILGVLTGSILNYNRGRYISSSYISSILSFSGCLIVLSGLFEVLWVSFCGGLLVVGAIIYPIRWAGRNWLWIMRSYLFSSSSKLSTRGFRFFKSSNWSHSLSIIYPFSSNYLLIKLMVFSNWIIFFLCSFSMLSFFFSSSFNTFN